MKMPGTALVNTRPLTETLCPHDPTLSDVCPCNDPAEGPQRPPRRSVRMTDLAACQAVGMAGGGSAVSLVGFQAQNHPQQAARDDVDDRATEPTVFATFESRFGVFTIDVAAAAHNTKCSRYFTRDEDGTAQPWAGERVWCNPPYSDIAPWVHKAWDEHSTTIGIVMLLPANRTEQRWWQELVEPYRDQPGSGLRVEFLPGRMRFLKPGQQRIGSNERPPFGVCLLIWSPPALAPATAPGANCSGCRYCDPQMTLFDPNTEGTDAA